MSPNFIFRRLLPAAALASGLAATTAMAQTAASPAPPMSKPAAITPPPPATTPVTPAAARNTGTGTSKLVTSQKFTTAAAAQASCPTDTVVWSSLTKSHSFHMPNSKYYGKTKHGAYVCEQTALAAGFHKARG